MLKLIFSYAIKFNIRVLSFLISPVLALLNTIPGVSTLIQGVAYIANRFTVYLFFVEDLLFIPHSLTVLFVNGILFLIGLYQMAWVYSVMAKILNFGRNNVVKG